MQISAFGIMHRVFKNKFSLVAIAASWAVAVAGSIAVIHNMFTSDPKSPKSTIGRGEMVLLGVCIFLVVMPGYFYISDVSPRRLIPRTVLIDTRST